MLGNTTTSPYYPFWPYYGYFDLGPMQIPPLPRVVGMTDQVTGTIYYLTWSQASNHIILSTTIPGPIWGRFIRVYGPNDGPIVDSSGWFLGVSNGHLVVTLFNNASRDSGGPIWAVDPTQAQQVASVTFQLPPITAPFGSPDTIQNPHMQWTAVNTQ